MTALDALIPRSATNDYRGGRVPLYFFYALIAMVTFRSFVHFVKDDSGVNSIASIMIFSGTPDPNNVIYTNLETANFQTLDAGKTWKNVVGNMPEEGGVTPFTAIAFSKDNLIPAHLPKHLEGSTFKLWTKKIDI